MLVSLLLVNTLRGYYYSNSSPVFIELADASTFLLKAVVSFRFIVDRWGGVEGVMAVSSYPDKDIDLFLGALIEKSEIEKTHFINRCHLLIIVLWICLNFNLQACLVQLRSFITPIHFSL